ncbi:GspE/PulE/PilB domain-containing protein [Zavarzinella formosa]|uniref:GspE/PulE/PilB domain-containing protein n=1 Tax=Zavarzinella formosa TaxID=360055 RepID=UPI00030B30D5|nr:hypothetical protein [Zavarzinella formosa]
MISIGQFFVYPDAVEYLPACLAWENNILPLKVSGNTIEILMPDRGAENADLIQKLQFILNKDIIPRFADAKTVRKGIKIIYPSEDTGPSQPASPSMPPGRRRY